MEDNMYKKIIFFVENKINGKLDKSIYINSRKINHTDNEIFVTYKFLNNKFSYDILIDIYQYLKIFGLGFISLNQYKHGLHINFVYNPSYSYTYNDNILIECPGVNEIKLKINEKYFLGTYRVGSILNKSENLKEFKLIKIQDILNGYLLFFEGIEEPFITLTRGHIQSKYHISNRLDHLIIESTKTSFIKSMLKKSSIEFGFAKESDKHIKKILNKLLKLS